MNKLFLSVFMVSLFGVAGVAQAKEIIKAKISGMVCPMCAQNIEKSFKAFIKDKTIVKFDVDLDSKLVTFDIAEGKTLSDEAVGKGIKDAGYLLKSLERTSK